MKIQPLAIILMVIGLIFGFGVGWQAGIKNYIEDTQAICDHAPYSICKALTATQRNHLRAKNAYEYMVEECGEGNVQESCPDGECQIITFRCEDYSFLDSYEK